MDRHLEIFRALLLGAFVFQALIDVLGAVGFFYGLYEEEVFSYAGYGQLVSFEAYFSVYVAWMLAYYLSLASLAMCHWSAWITVPLALALSFFSSFISGIYIGTPFELVLGWLAWNTYVLAIGMALFSETVSARFKFTLSSTNVKN